MRTPIIITFANQKGGVGKTTLCVTFANFLAMMGVRVLVADLDFQHSIVKCRNSDIKTYGEDKILYEVASYNPTNEEEMAKTMEKLHNDPSIEVVLIDSSGSLKAPGLITLFANTDIIVTPYQYDVVTSPSTQSFLMFLDRLKDRMQGKVNFKIFLIPNRVNPRVGKRAELKAWEITRNIYAKHGVVTEKLPVRSEMTRLSTIAALDRHINFVRDIYMSIYATMFDTDKPLREVKLEGIQLVENIEKKDKKKTSDTTQL